VSRKMRPGVKTRRSAHCVPVADARGPIADIRFPKPQTHNWVVLGHRESGIGQRVSATG